MAPPASSQRAPRRQPERQGAGAEGQFAGTGAWRTVSLPRRRFGDDRSGALLILTGVLLVLGFVIIGTTLVQLNAAEDKTTRSQRDPLMESVDTLVSSFSESIRKGIEVGETDLTYFAEYSGGQQALFRDTATHNGIYAEARLNPNPALTTYAGPGGCDAWDPTVTTGGIIVGYEKETFKESIVGAVYTMEFRDGRQTVILDHYVKIHECTDADLRSFPVGINQQMGGATLPLTALQDDDDEHASVPLVEELTGTTVYTNRRPSSSTVTDVYGSWNSEENVKQDDNNQATRPSPPVIDALRIRFDATTEMNDVRALMGDVVFNSFQMTVDAKHNLGAGSIGTDDYLQLRAYAPGVPLLPYWTHNFMLTSSETRYSLLAPPPSGNPEWTYDEFVGVTWELSVVTVGLKDTDHSFNVEYVNPLVSFSGPQGYQLNMEFDWPVIPPIYDSHSLTAVYKIDATTTAETFQFQVQDPTTGVWADLGPALLDSGAWETWGPVVIPSQYHNDGEPLLRLVDKVTSDLATGDRSTIQLDYLSVTSSVAP